MNNMYCTFYLQIERLKDFKDFGNYIINAI